MELAEIESTRCIMVKDQTLGDKYKTLIEKYVDDSLLSYIFPCLVAEFKNAYDKVQVTQRLIKFSGVLFHLLWVQSKAYKSLFISSELEDCFQLFWNGKYINNSAFPLQIIDYANQSLNKDFKEYLVKQSDVYAKWAIIINQYMNMEYKEFNDLNHPYYELLEELLISLPILKNSLIEKDNDGTINLAIRISKKNTIMTEVYPIVKEYDSHDNKYLYLHNVRKEENDYIFTYTTIDGDVVQSESSRSNKKFYPCWLNIIGKVEENGMNHFVLNKLVGNSYNIINKLGYCFSDVNQKSPERLKMQEELFYEFRDELEDMKCNNRPILDKYTALLLRVGSTQVVRHIIEQQTILYVDYLKKICNDENKYRLYEKYIEDNIQEQNNIIDRYFRVDIEKNGIRDIKKKRKIDIICAVIMMAAGDEGINIPCYVETLIDKIEILKKLKCNDNMTGKVVDAGKMLERTIRFLIVYYTMLVSYAQVFFIESKQSADVNIIIEKSEKEAQKVIKKTVKELQAMPLGLLINKLLELCKELSPSITNDCKNQENKAETQKINRVFDSKVFKYEIFSKFTERVEMCKFQKLEELTGNLTKYINQSKHDLLSVDYFISNNLSNSFIDDVLKFMDFLRYNTYEEKEVETGRYLTYDPIYPMVVSFERVYRNKDGIILSEYKMVTDDRLINNIKMISLYNYEAQEEYYCLPNVSKIFGEWWIEPFLIKCSFIDREILNLGEKNEN